MYYLINSEQGMIDSYDTTYELATALQAEIYRQRDNHSDSVDADTWNYSVNDEWYQVDKRVKGLLTRAQDGAREIHEPIFLCLPNGEIIVLAEIHSAQ